MSGGIYQIIVLLVCAFAIVKGFRKGFTGQICGILGLGFGIVCSYIFTGPFSRFLQEHSAKITDYPLPQFVYSVVAAALIYFTVYTAFKMLTKVLKNAMNLFHIGMLDRLIGSAFSVLKYMLCLSIIYNLILCVSPTSPLIEYSKADDGNMVGSVLQLAPTLLGCISAEDLAHAMQLIDAKKISRNFNEIKDVINTEPITVGKNEA